MQFTTGASVKRRPIFMVTEFHRKSLRLSGIFVSISSVCRATNVSRNGTHVLKAAEQSVASMYRYELYVVLWSESRRVMMYSYFTSYQVRYG